MWTHTDLGGPNLNIYSREASITTSPVFGDVITVSRWVGDMLKVKYEGRLVASKAPSTDLTC